MTSRRYNVVFAKLVFAILEKNVGKVRVSNYYTVQLLCKTLSTDEVESYLNTICSSFTLFCKNQHVGMLGLVSFYLFLITQFVGIRYKPANQL